MLSSKKQSCNYLKSYHVGRNILTPLFAICVLDWIFLIASAAYSVAYNARDDDPSFEEPPIEWSRITATVQGCNGGQVVWMFTGISVETVNLLIQIPLYRKNLLHPIAALVLSLCMLANWAWAAVSGSMMDFGCEVSFPTAWDALFFTRVGFACLSFFIYVGYLYYSSVAVHKWRRSRGERMSDSESIEMKQ